MLEAADGERFEEAAQLRDAMRTVQTLHDRQQKMATAELGHRDVFGLKHRPGRRRRARLPGPPRPGRRTRRARERRGDGRRRRVRPATRAAVGAAIQQFYELRGAPPEVHVPSEPDEREALESWLSERAGRRVRIVVPQRGEKRGLVDLANRNAALAYQTRFNQAHRGAVRRARDAAAGAGALRRCRGGSSASTSRRFRAARRWRRWSSARTAACGAGEYRKYPDSEVRAAARLGRSVGRRPLASDLPASNNDFAAMHEVVLRRYRELLEQGGPFPDLVLIDGGKGQLSAAYAALEAARARESGRRRHRQEGRAALHARPRRRDRARGERSGAAADSADSRRGAPLCRDVPSARAGDARPALGARPTCPASGPAAGARC